ncbi:MAG: hypothetical protein II903_10580 [Spirochaetales bacterium]|nr:hypothetical protein [Spirochaetales bacterium]
MNCYLPWNLKDMTNISAEKLQKNISQQSSYIELYRSELLKESLRFNIASLLRHVCLNRTSFGTDDMSKTATDCLIVFLHASVFRKVAYFAPTDAENPAVGKCARNLHRLMLENVKSTMRFIDYEVLLKYSRGEIEESSLQDERRRIHAQVFPSDEVINVCDRDDINNAFFTLIDLENGKAKGFVDFDVMRNTSLDPQICQRLSAVPRLDEKFPQSRYGIIGSCNSYLDTPFIKYSGSYYSFVTAFSLRRISSVVSELAASIPVPVAEEQVLEEPVIEQEQEEEPAIAIVPQPEQIPEEPESQEETLAAETVEEPEEEPVIESEPEPVTEPEIESADEQVSESESEPDEEPAPTEPEPAYEEPFSESEAETSPEPEIEADDEEEEEPASEITFESEPESEPVAEEPAPQEPEPINDEPFSEPEPEVYAEPEMTEASDDEEDDIPFDEPSEEEPAEQPQEQPEASDESESMFDEDDEIENSEDDAEGSMPSDDDSAYLETDEYEYPDEFEEDTSESEAEAEPEEDVYEDTEYDNDASFSPASELPYDEELADEPFERQAEEYTALVSPDTYEYLDEAKSSDFTSDPMLDEQESDGYYYDDEDEENDEVPDDNEPDPYSGESLFSIVDESDEEDAPQEEEKPEVTFVLASHNQEQSFPKDEDDYPQEEPVPEAEPEDKPEQDSEPADETEPEPETEPEAQAPLAEPEPETLPLLDQILKFSPSRNNPITQYLSACDMQQKKEIVRFIEMARKAWLIDGKDKMFTIPDSNISVAVFSETQDPMLAIQRRENIGAVMYASQNDSWNSLEISYDSAGQFVKADFIRVAKSSFTDWQWKVVEKMGQRLIERRGK